MAVGLTVQPEVLEALGKVPQFRGRGLLERINYAIPESRLGSRSRKADPIDPDVEATFNDKMIALARSLRVHRLQSDHRVRLVVSPEALDVLLDFKHSYEHRLRPSGDLRPYSGWVGKLHGKVPRIAAMLHSSDHPRDYWERPIDVKTMERAITVGRYLLAHALAVYGLMRTDPEAEKAEFLLEWLSDRVRWEPEWARFKPGKLLGQVSSKGRFPDVAAVRETLAELAKHRWVRPIKPPGRKPGQAGRNPSEEWELHPKLVNRDDREEP